jgi:predicted nucleic acid-binding protein
MAANLFIDTNILVYAHDVEGGVKHTRARALIEEKWHEPDSPCLSVQVLQELFVNLYRKGVPLTDAHEVVTDYAQPIRIIM